MTLGFEDLEDPEERRFFQSLPTSFSLPDTTVDRLIAVARRLLRESPDYQAFLAALAGENGSRSRADERVTPGSDRQAR